MARKTIYALASGAGVAGVAVLRVSGPHSRLAVELLTRTAAPAPRYAALRPLYDPLSGDLLDRALVLFFAAPASFTGEDCAEFHIHGGRAVTDSVLAALSRVDGLRLAEPGEFTRRAFENGKLDLTAAEAVADLVHAQTVLQQRQALSQMGGALRDLYEGWRTRLARILAYAEAEIDFPDEDLPDSLIDRVRPQIAALSGEIAAHLADGRRGERLRDGIQVAILGAPNAGKSSLMNALARRDVAIVNDTAGTTRDVLEVALNIDGFPVLLYDTAGLREKSAAATGHDAIEAEGIRRALKKAEDADILVLVFDATTLPSLDAATLALLSSKALVLFNKSDACVVDRLIPNGLPAGVRDGLFVSALSGAGLDAFFSTLSGALSNAFAPKEGGGLTRERHRAALRSAQSSLSRIMDLALDDEILAEELRLAIRDIGRITGRVDVEDLLDIIFRDFCIGK